MVMSNCATNVSMSDLLWGIDICLSLPGSASGAIFVYGFLESEDRVEMAEILQKSYGRMIDR